MALGQMFLFPLEAPPLPAMGSPANALRSKAALAKPVGPAFASLSSAPAPAAASRSESSAAEPIVDRLRAQVQRIQRQGRCSEAEGGEPIFSVGGAVLDGMLPHRGLRRGTIVQWIGDAQGSGACSLSIIAAAAIARSEISGSKPLVIFDSGQNFYPPAAISLGVPAERMVIVHQGRDHCHADKVWAIDQALRCNAVAAVWVELGTGLNDRDARRLQLAAEAGGTVGLFVRPAAVRGRSSFADINWHVSEQRFDASSDLGSFRGSGDPSHRRLRVQVDRCRGGAEGAVAMIEIRSDSSTAGKVTLITSPTNSLPISKQAKSKHEPNTLASDLAHRLANPTTAKRGPAKRLGRDTRRAS